MPVYVYRCEGCGQNWELQFLVKEIQKFPEVPCGECGGRAKRVFTPFTIVGGEWNWQKGYRTGIDDPEKEIRFDMKNLEESMTREGNLKKYYDKKRALENFAEAHRETLE